MAARSKLIPKSFRMGSLVFAVREMPMGELKKLIGDDYAIFMPDTQAILIPEPSGTITESFREQIFFHELAHAILWITNSKDYGNEAVIDFAGHVLKQYMETATFK